MQISKKKKGTDPPSCLCLVSVTRPRRHTVFSLFLCLPDPRRGCVCSVLAVAPGAQSGVSENERTRVPGSAFPGLNKAILVTSLGSAIRPIFQGGKPRPRRGKPLAQIRQLGRKNRNLNSPLGTPCLAPLCNTLIISTMGGGEEDGGGRVSQNPALGESQGRPSEK